MRFQLYLVFPLIFPFQWEVNHIVANGQRGKHACSSNGSSVICGWQLRKHLRKHLRKTPEKKSTWEKHGGKHACSSNGGSVILQGGKTWKPDEPLTTSWAEWSDLITKWGCRNRSQNYLWSNVIKVSFSKWFGQMPMYIVLNNLGKKNKWWCNII